MFSSQMRSIYTCSNTPLQYFNHLAKILKNNLGVWNLPAGTIMPAGIFYQLADGDSRAGWLV